MEMNIYIIEYLIFISIHFKKCYINKINKTEIIMIIIVIILIEKYKSAFP